MRIKDLLNLGCKLVPCGQQGKTVTINTDKVEINIQPDRGPSLTISQADSIDKLKNAFEDNGRRLFIGGKGSGSKSNASLGSVHSEQNKRQSTERYLVLHASIPAGNNDLVRFEFKQEKDGNTYVDYINKASPLYSQLFRACGRERDIMRRNFDVLLGKHVWIQREETKITFLRDFIDTCTVEAEPKWHRCALKTVEAQAHERYVKVMFSGLDLPLCIRHEMLITGENMTQLLRVLGMVGTMAHGNADRKLRLEMLRECIDVQVWVREVQGIPVFKKYAGCQDVVPKHTHTERKRVVTIASVEKAKKEDCLMIGMDLDGAAREYVRIPTFGDSAKSLVLAVDPAIKTTQEDKGERLSDIRLDYLKRLAIGKQLTLIDCPCGHAEVKFERMKVENPQTAKQTLAAAKDGPLRTGKYNARIVSVCEEKTGFPHLPPERVLKIRYAIRDGEYKGRTLVDASEGFAINQCLYQICMAIGVQRLNGIHEMLGHNVTIDVRTKDDGRAVTTEVMSIKPEAPIVEHKTGDDHRLDAVRYAMGNGVDGRILHDGKVIGNFIDIKLDYNALAEKFAKSPRIQYRPKPRFSVGDKVVTAFTAEVYRREFFEVAGIEWDAAAGAWIYCFKDLCGSAPESDIKRYVPEPPITMTPEELLDGWRFPIGAKLQGRVNSERKCVCCGGKIHLSESNVVWPHVERDGATEHLYAHPMCLFKKTGLHGDMILFHSTQWREVDVKNKTKRDKFRAQQQKGK